MNIVLVGYRCCGKTTVGRLLARDLAKDFLDTDPLIEKKTGLPIHSYVTQNGWSDFRRVEREVVEEIAARDNVVIATGGGAVIDQENVSNLRKNGWVVWLHTDTTVIRDRMKNEENRGELRPSLSAADPVEEVDRVLKERTRFYECASDYMLDTSWQDPEEVARAIVTALRERDKNHSGEKN